MLKAMENEAHTIGGCRVEITVANNRHQERTNFMDLNDDCILEILSMKCLNVMDLCAVAETCHRLKEIAGRVFRREYKRCSLKELAGYEVKLAKRILMNFGSLISDLKLGTIPLQSMWTGVLDYFVRFCDNNTLKTLSLGNCIIPMRCANKFRTILSKVEDLTLVDSTFESGTIFFDSESLIRLKIGANEEVIAPIMETTYPNLQHFNFDYEYGETDLESFITRHPGLKTLKIWNYGNESSLLQVITDNCKQLEKLSFHLVKDDEEYTFFDVSRLGHIKKLNINCPIRDVTKMEPRLNNFNVLESLRLEDIEIESQFVRILPLMKNLKVLRLEECYGLHNLNEIGDMHQLTDLEIIVPEESYNLDIVVLVKRLINLKNLKVWMESFSIDSTTYLRVVDVVRRRPDKSKLVFESNATEVFDQRYSHIVEMVKI